MENQGNELINYMSVSGNDIEDEVVNEEDVTMTMEQNQQTVTVVSREDIKIAFSEALDEYFSNETLCVMQVDAGIKKELIDFTLSDVCLVIISMTIIAQGILKIIGGKSWNK